MNEDKAAPAFEPFSMLIHAIERDLERTPGGRGGAIHYTPETTGHGGMGHHGDYLLKEWREVTDALAFERDRADRAEAATKRAAVVARAEAWRDASTLAESAYGAQALVMLPAALNQCADEAEAEATA